MHAIEARFANPTGQPQCKVSAFLPSLSLGRELAALVSRRLRSELLGGRFLQVPAETVAHGGKNFVLVVRFAA